MLFTPWECIYPSSFSHAFISYHLNAYTVATIRTVSKSMYAETSYVRYCLLKGLFDVQKKRYLHSKDSIKTTK